MPHYVVIAPTNNPTRAFDNLRCKLLFNCYSLTHPLHDQKIQITLSDANSFLLRIWLLQECLLQPSPWLNEVESAGDGSDAPQGGGFDVGGLETDPRW
uniref:Uncharacterized protein n=1 Tax=Glycine max TaxID=3847 RepID=C6SW60_SOYBN|nr:unknown [Glycine max]